MFKSEFLCPSPIQKVLSVFDVHSRGEIFYVVVLIQAILARSYERHIFCNRAFLVIPAVQSIRVICEPKQDGAAVLASVDSDKHSAHTPGQGPV